MRRKKIIYLVGVVVVLVTTAIVVLLSRGGNGYMNVIPSRVKALVAVELSKIGVGDVPGVDFSRKAYLFETADGSLGLVAAVDSKSDVESFLESMQKSGKATKPVERKGYLFTVINDNFVVGVSSSAVLVMGPAVADEQASIQRKMVKYLSSDEDAVSESPLFRQLSTLDGPVTIVTSRRTTREVCHAIDTRSTPWHQSRRVASLCHNGYQRRMSHPEVSHLLAR